MERRPLSSGEESKLLTRRAFLTGAAAAAAAGAGLYAAGTAEKQERSAEADGDKQPSVPAEPHLRIRHEIDSAKKLLGGDPSLYLTNPYLVSSLYYSDRFLEKVSARRGDMEPSMEILQGIAPFITPDVRKRYIGSLHRKGSSTDPSSVHAPFVKLDFGRGVNHPDAVDLFAPEGTHIGAVQGGIVVLAESGWKKGEPFSTSSAYGGNSVIIFSPETKKFYRYCHLAEVHVHAGSWIEGGTTLGTVGSSGINASLPGHGGHLHLEMNQYEESGRIRSLLANDIKRELPIVQAMRK